ncbi:pantoate--beta-alanine ligase [Salipaludibacillus aurantiacus]|uniref:Pantothenate synthetase n=1 Tax=Salipaludibacillus aurantiacus TaxID=1601833 RepID=A0A1H9P6P8_9BACI|nr:pantoate--beta-alanine ligase [Salipaludibacillus aurantiacus]SER43489.1 pantoate--beta-alanine ligase [Salipaludibacillus aurantiacus]
MIEINRISELKDYLKSEKEKGKIIGFVPTMGFLHEGHLKLVEKAKEGTDLTVMSIFVNPLQFGEGEDFEDYPRDHDRDMRLAETHGVDVLFYPHISEMYPGPMSATLTVHEGTEVLCGASRPGHFDGVATVVMKLFQAVNPDYAYFGMKDAQQVAVIKRMVSDYHMDVTVVPVDIVREEDGLAKSSRNVNLTESEREEAPQIYKTVKEAVTKALSGEFQFSYELESWTRSKLEKRISGQIDYVSVYRFPELTPLSRLEGDLILAVAVYYSNARLIDNQTWRQGEMEGEN